MSDAGVFIGLFYISRLMWIIRHPNIMRMLNIFYMMVLSIRYLEKIMNGATRNYDNTLQLKYKSGMILP